MDRLVTIQLGTETVQCSESLANRIGVICYGDTDIAHFSEYHGVEKRIAMLGQAILEGLTGDRAVLRALVLINEQSTSEQSARNAIELAAEQTKAAGMRLAAEREATKRQRGE
jgi:hypothetical protein